ncbi:MAG: hypothetical protein ACPGLY_24440 [Rubripirellula sp.]
MANLTITLVSCVAGSDTQPKHEIDSSNMMFSSLFLSNQRD